MKESGPSPVVPTPRSANPAPKAADDREGMDIDGDDVNGREPERPNRRADPEYQDGRYGFPDGASRDNYRREDRWDNRRSEGRLYSDNMRRNDRGNDRGYRR